MKHWQTKNKTTVFENRIKLVEHSIVTENGADSKYLVIEGGHSVAILIYNKSKDKMIFVKEYRYPIDKEILNVVGGAVDKDEKLEVAILRELKEETGIIANNLTKLGSTYTDPGRQDRVNTYFFCDDYEIDNNLRDNNDFEKTDLIEISVKEVENLILSETVDPGILAVYTFAKLKGLI